jgi:hypothetical protein
MKYLTLALLAIGLIGPAHAADKGKPTVWTTFRFADQQCVQVGSPTQLMLSVRTNYHVDPDTTDIRDDDGVVVSLVISWPMPDGNTATVTMFRTPMACQVYAVLQRKDTKQYD